MTESELLEQFNVSICEFSSSQWSRNGFIDPINRVVYINGDLDQDTRLKVILQLAMPSLPEAVQQQGISVDKSSSNILMAS